MFARVRGRFRRDRADQRGDIVAFEGFYERGELVINHAQAVNIACGRYFGIFAAELLGRHIIECAHELVRLSDIAVHGLFHETEIHEFDAAVGRDHYIGRLDVAVNGFQRVHGG